MLGLAFKPETDDMRFAPSIEIINALQKEGAKISVFDPAAVEKAKKDLNGVEYCSNAYAVAKDAEALLLLTEWNDFLEMDFGKVKDSMKTAFLFDGRNCLDAGKMNELGFKYFGIGLNS